MGNCSVTLFTADNGVYSGTGSNPDVAKSQAMLYLAGSQRVSPIIREEIRHDGNGILPSFATDDSATPPPRAYDCTFILANGVRICGKGPSAKEARKAALVRWAGLDYRMRADPVAVEVRSPDGDIEVSSKVPLPPSPRVIGKVVASLLDMASKGLLDAHLTLEERLVVGAVKSAESFAHGGPDATCEVQVALVNDYQAAVGMVVGREP
jgi:hypothetical protein